jgi:dTDP-4-amino-4,6-dideoxygalactose transaminase
VQDPIPFIDLQTQRKRLGDSLTRAIQQAVESGQWILGPQVQALEESLARFAGVKHAVSCANGTDALALVLRAWDVGPGDAVFVPSFTFAATAEAVALVGATPVFADVLEDTFNLDPASLEAALAMVRRAGTLAPKVVIAVDLYGQPADYRKLEPIAKRERLLLLSDTAQAFGATLDGRQTAATGDAAATSFYPAKPLGSYGDGGACFTNDDGLAGLIRSLRTHGEGAHRYEHVRVGTNSRLDTIQAAILCEKLKIFPDENAARERAAERYNLALGVSNRIGIPHLIKGARSVWAQYTIRVEDRAKLQSDLKSEGIPTAIHYPIALGKQRAYRHFPSVATPVAERLSATVVSLPMHPYLDEPTQNRITKAVLKSVG